MATYEPAESIDLSVTTSDVDVAVITDVTGTAAGVTDNTYTGGAGAGDFYRVLDATFDETILLREEWGNIEDLFGSATLTLPFLETTTSSVASELGEASLSISISVAGIGATGAGAGQADLELPSLSAESETIYGNYGIADISLTALSGSGDAIQSEVGTGAIELPILEAVSFTVEGSGAVSLPEIEVSATGYSDADEDASGTGSAEVTLPKFRGSADGIAQAIGTSELDVPFLITYGVGVAGFLAEANLEIGLRVSAQGTSGVVASGGIELPFLEAAGDGLADSAPLGIADVVLPMVAQDADGSIASYIPPEFWTEDDEYVTIGGERITVRKALEQYDLKYETVFSSMNLKASAVTEYENYSFVDVCRVGDNYIGCSSEGIFILDGPDDDGSEIAAIVQKIAADNGNANTKRATDAYLKILTDGDFAVQTVADKSSAWTEKVVSAEEYDQVHTEKVAPLPKFKGRSIGWGVRNTSGSKIELEEVELVLQVSDRKI